MRFITTLLISSLLTVSAFTHHQHEQQTLDVSQDQDIQQQHTMIQQAQANARVMQQVIELEHTQNEIETEIAMNAEIEMDTDMETETEGEEKLWPFDRIIPMIREFFRPGQAIPLNQVLMKESTLIRATETSSHTQHFMLDPQYYSGREIQEIKTAHDSWAALLSWLANGGGYEFNWARMWEPETKRYRSYVPSVKSQRCGTCWDFSTSAMIASHMAIRYGIDRESGVWQDEQINPISLSEGELFECTGKSGVDDVCNGNWIQNAAARVKATGIAQNADYTFSKKLTDNANKCRDLCTGCMPKPPATTAPPKKNCNYWPQSCPSIKSSQRTGNPRFFIDNLVSVTNPSTPPAVTNTWLGSSQNPLQVEQIRDLLRKKGPLGFYFRVEGTFGAGGLAGQDVWPNNGAIYTTPCTQQGINHAMVIVGYGKTPFNAPTQPNMDYWIVLNSWGNWSTDGFIKIQAGVNLCNSEQIAFYPELPAKDLAVSDPCASQPTEKKKILCFQSLCDNTILSDSRYCQQKGRANFCQHVRTTKGMCTKKCGSCKGLTGEQQKTCKKDTFEGKCPAECKLFDRLCRIDFVSEFQKIFDFFKPLDERIAAIVPKTDLRLAQVTPQPITQSFEQILRGAGNYQQGGNIAVA